MVSFLVIVALAIFFGVAVYLESREVCDFIVIVLATVFVGFLVHFFVSLVVAGVAELEPCLLEEYELYAFQDNLSTGGHFFLGSGSIKNVQRYYYLCNHKNGLKMESLTTDEAYLNISDSPRIEVYTYEFKNKFLRKNFIIVEDPFYKIYIPEGSIKYDFSVDLR